ncbi:MAG: carbamoyltransferase [Bacteroidia bacterium]|nr:carbamoyltransferase [Bacteroidia bacterium]
MNILGISAFYHDSAAALVRDGHIVAAAQEERFSRIKHDPGFPAEAIRFCLAHAGLTLADLDWVVFYDKPLLKFERLLETYYAEAPRGLASFLQAMPVWLREKMFLKRLLRQGLAQIGPYDPRRVQLLFPEHHLSHAASAFYPSPFEEAAILTLDGVGEWATASIATGRGNEITVLKELHFPDSVGLLYSAFTHYCGFKVNSGEYKLMGLAPYGHPEAPDTRRYAELIRTRMVDIRPDGSIRLDQRYFRYTTGLTMTHDKRWEALFGFPRRSPETDLAQHHANLALAIQQVTEEIVLNMATEARRLTGLPHLCMAGGVALNCVANGKLLRQRLFEDIFIQPAAGDAGGALGAALAAWHIYAGQDRQTAPGLDGMQGAYLGPAYESSDIQAVIKKYHAAAGFFPDLADLVRQTASLLASGAVVGWFQGRMEFGPRALGNRSILGDPRRTDMQQKLNLKIKYRESFRPFAPAVLTEEAQTYFNLTHPSPYMLLVADVAEQHRLPQETDFAQGDLRTRLYSPRSVLPAITHLDFSARVQTVHAETNPRFRALLEAFSAETGTGVLVNTSFNVRGEPIVCTPEDAYRCFMRTEMDYLVIGDYLFAKSEQPAWPDTDHWQQAFTLD